MGKGDMGKEWAGATERCAKERMGVGEMGSLRCSVVTSLRLIQ
jgi:hypothetical protein